jgi:hypothetical protein
VYGVVFARLHLHGQHRKAVVVVYQIVHLTLLFVVVVMQREAVGMEFLGYNRLIDGSQIHAPLVLQHGVDVVAIEYGCEQTHVVHIQF